MLDETAPGDGRPGEADVAAADRRAREALVGCAVGDAHGERFFGDPDGARRDVLRRTLPVAGPGGLRWTDDTLQSCSVVAVLQRHAGDLPQDELADHLAEHLAMDRGYGHGSRELLWAIRNGADWRSEARSLFGGGSWGNGAAMRSAVIGAWHAGSWQHASALSEQQALVTHAHPEGSHGAMVVAAVASVLAGSRGEQAPSWQALVDVALACCPPGRVADRVRTAAEMLDRGDVGDSPAVIAEAVRLLGTGQEAAAWDTVPFVVWSVAQSPDDLEATFWRTVAGLGDRDTTSAIACALVACRTGLDATLRAWAARVEPLPAFVG